MSVLDDVMEFSLTLIDHLSNVSDEEIREKIVTEYLIVRSSNVNVGDFKKDLEWFNVSSSLSLKEDLKGKLVILDFFTYCCINCLHILPKMREIEEEHSTEGDVIVVGVHSAKFDNEKDSSNILSALQRYGISHPVVNDAEGELWSALGIPCWPTLLVLNPMGQPIYVAVGESNMQDLQYFVRRAAAFYRQHKLLSDHKLPVSPLAHLKKQGPLLFPGKVACGNTPSGQLLAIADTGHHRLVVCSTSGEIQHIVGGDTPGFLDGDFSSAKFYSPQGLAFVGSDTIYVADTQNNAIRKIDLVSEKVRTVSPRQNKDGRNEDAPLSPWDICALPDDSGLLIAAAGSHQLWALFLRDTLWWRNMQMTTGSCVAVAGTGREENRNNVYPHAAGFAQPSGVCVAQTLYALFIADSESSSVRRVDLKDGRVSAVVGGGRSPTDLFCFGDVDGRQWDVRLQHPLGVAWSPAGGGALYVLDSYNHKLKIVKPEERCCKTVLGTGAAGNSVKPGAEQFSEPGGICASPCGSVLYVADTNNNCIKVVQCHTTEDPPYSVSELDMKMPKTHAPSQKSEYAAEVGVKVAPRGGTVTWHLTVELEQGWSYTEDAPQRWSVQLPNASGWKAKPSKGELLTDPLHLVVKVPPGDPDSAHEVLFEASAFICDHDTCQRKTLQLALKIVYKQGASERAECHLLHIVRHDTP